MKQTLLFAAIIGAAAMQAFGQDSSAQQAQAPMAMATPTESKTDEAVTNVTGKVAGLEEDYLATKATVDGLAKLKISGYVQAQYKTAVEYKDATDSTKKYYYPVGDFAGGAFPDGVGGMFQERRGRLKFQYDNGVEQAAVQLDATLSGVTIKEAWAGLKEPWLKTIGVRAGALDRPFGFEPCYSSGTRESPEEARFIQTLLPDDYDLGAVLEILPSDKTPKAVQFFNFRGGVYTGNGLNPGVENDNTQDLIGRFGFSLPINSINMAIDGGLSGYLGGVTNTDTTSVATTKTVASVDTSYYVKFVKSSDGHTDSLTVARHGTASADTVWSVKQVPNALSNRGNEWTMSNGKWTKSTTGEFGKVFDRKYGGFDLQLYYDIPVIGGLSLRTEYMQGDQPGTKTSSKIYNPGRSSNTAVYLRKFQGYYGEWVQNINPINSQFVLKYDVYDPNTDVAGSGVSSQAGFTTADLQYNTLGLGLIYYWGSNVKLTAYYEQVTNEKANADLSGTGTGAAFKPGAVDYSQKLKDDVFTFRVQYKF